MWFFGFFYDTVDISLAGPLNETIEKKKNLQQLQKNYFETTN